MTERLPLCETSEPKHRAESAAALWRAHQQELYRCVLGIVKDEATAQDAVQIALTRYLEQGAQVAPESRRSWLFRVAANAALEAKRRETRERRHGARVAAWNVQIRGSADGVQGSELERGERVARVRAALDSLPAEQREVVWRRIHGSQKFVEIAAELQIPLGTVLTRMRAALAKLKGLLGAEDEIK